MQDNATTLFLKYGRTKTIPSLLRKIISNWVDETQNWPGAIDPMGAVGLMLAVFLC